MADTDIKTISISVTTSTKAATQNIDRLIRSLERLTSLVGSLKTAGQSIDFIAKGLDALKSIDLKGLPEQMERIADAMKSLTGLNFAEARSLNAQAKMLSAQNRQKELAIREVTAATEAEAEARKKKMLELGLYRRGETKSGETKEEYDPKNITGAEYKASAAMLAIQVKMSLLGSTAKVLMSVLNGVWFVVSKGVNAFARLSVSIGKTLINIGVAPYKRLASAVKDLTKRFVNFFAAVKRIAVYRAIRTALKEITQAFREGIGNLYQYSLLIEGTFAKSMDMLATSALYAKNSLAAMVAPIINELAPAVDYLVDQFVDLLNVVNETLASLTGAETWTKAIKYPTQFAEAADDATGSAKKLRATLLGFDEINRLDDNNKGSRGRAADQLDYSKMFEEKTVSTKAKNYVKVIKDAFKKGDFTKIGETLGENLKKGLDSIKWDDVKSAVERNARSVATLINGFINVPDLGTKIGRTIAEVFNTAVRKMSTFFNTVEWHNVGKFLGDGINGILTTFNTRDLGRHIAGIINSAVTLIHNFVNTVEWKKFATFLADGINGFFTDINTKELAKTISDVLKKAAGFVVDLLRATDFQKIGDKIGDLIKGLDWVSILAGLASVVMNAITSALDLLVGLIKKSPLFGTAVALTIASKLAVAITGSGIASLIGTAIAKVVGDSAASSAVSSAVGTAMTKSVGSGASASAAAITARSTAAGVLAGVALTALAGVAIGWLADKITDGESTAWLEKAFGISLRRASHTGNEPTSDSTKRLNTWLTGGATKAYAQGGIPETGSVFLAGERGAELITSANGVTSVSNRDQIAESVAIGNEEGNAILRDLLTVARQISAKDNSVQITTGQITSALNRANARSGNTVVAVG